MVRIAIRKVAINTPLALSTKSNFKYKKNKIKFRIAPRLINLVMKSFEIASFIITTISLGLIS